MFLFVHAIHLNSPLHSPRIRENPTAALFPSKCCCLFALLVALLGLVAHLAVGFLHREFRHSRTHTAFQLGNASEESSWPSLGRMILRDVLESTH